MRSCLLLQSPTAGSGRSVGPPFSVSAATDFPGANMGVLLRYTTNESVSAEVGALLIAKALAGVRDWWCEPISFYAMPAEGGQLTGRTKIYLPSYTTADGGYVKV